MIDIGQASSPLHVEDQSRRPTQQACLPNLLGQSYPGGLAESRSSPLKLLACRSQRPITWVRSQAHAVVTAGLGKVLPCRHNY